MQLRQLIRAFRIITGGFPEVEFIRIRTPALQVDGTFTAAAAINQKSATATYGVTITPALASGDVQNVTITDGVAFAIAAATGTPAVGYSGFLTFIFTNTSGGAAGAATWDASYHLVGAWTAPANTKRSVIQFAWDAVNSIWVETFRSTADIA